MTGEALIETADLTKRYHGGALAVDGLCFSVHRGEVFGFLGQNGAGKTTTLKMLVGLIRPTRGTALVSRFPPGHPSGLAKLGALIEAPTFYPYLSGRANLRVLAYYCGAPDRSIDSALEHAGLSGVSRARFGSYSTGMRQRLGLAAALLKDPEVLILDEPSSGLDPQGMADMRETIRNLAAGERTVLLSSHLLNEVEQICDRVGIIHQGQLVAQGTLDELAGPRGFVVSVRQLERARALAVELLGAGAVRVEGGRLHLAIESERASEMMRTLVEAGVDVEESRTDDHSLEQVFLSLTTATVQTDRDRADH